MLVFLSILDTAEQKSLFIALYNENRKTMFYKAESILHNNGWAEDAVHDAFIKIAKNIESFLHLSCNERRYLSVTIVRNVAINVLRDSHQGQMVPLEDENIPIFEMDLLNSLISVENISRLGKIIEALPLKYKDVIQLRLVMKLSSKETARLLDITEGDVRVRLHRGRKILISNLSKGADKT